MTNRIQAIANLKHSRARPAAVAATAVLASLGCTPCLAGSSHNRAVARHHFVVVEHAITDTTIHAGRRGGKLGNLLVFANPVYDAANRIQVGRDQGFCIQVPAAGSWECFWTLFLKGGQITSEGPYHDGRDSVLAITGGTGRYAGAKGILKLHPRKAQASLFDFTYDLE